MIHIGGRAYEVVVDYRNAYNFEALRDRYSEVLERYDYIVGDWGYNQLRLKGFFKEANQKSTRDTTVAGLKDYLNEYCNFGCAYFVLERVNAKNLPKSPLADGETRDSDSPDYEGLAAEGEQAQVNGVNLPPPRQHLHPHPSRHDYAGRQEGGSKGTSHTYGGGNNGKKPERQDRHEKSDVARGDRPDKQDRQAHRGDRPERPDRLEHRQDRGDHRTDRSEHRTDRGERHPEQRHNRPEQRDRGGRPEHRGQDQRSGERPDRHPERNDRHLRGDRPDRQPPQDKQDRGERSERERGQDRNQERHDRPRGGAPKTEQAQGT
ncbi:YutD-like domain-containing protein [Paenibacillus koleovorans]|uniref:YutD-like domain-containing protein n=1 Tax=Paenibacillus koleovorans TaxID=121608 RepID=UPI001C3F87C9|nr:YutD-like domain-containing protein [Paenibacillus koleovorans]